MLKGRKGKKDRGYKVYRGNGAFPITPITPITPKDSPHNHILAVCDDFLTRFHFLTMGAGGYHFPVFRHERRHSPGSGRRNTTEKTP
ncbi:hypothetical protein CXU17_01465 [Akkermansia muciniphila]|nr:hypothetical protein CXU17_01465 [Akkermansia muciniphila]